VVDVKLKLKNLTSMKYFLASVGLWFVCHLTLVVASTSVPDACVPPWALVVVGIALLNVAVASVRFLFMLFKGLL